LREVWEEAETTTCEQDYWRIWAERGLIPVISAVPLSYVDTSGRDDESGGD